MIPGQEHIKKIVFFSHPDFTVGSGISPDQPQVRVADYTAGREFHAYNIVSTKVCLHSHPAPKNFLFTWAIIAYIYRICNC